MTVEPGTYELLIPQRASLLEGPFWLGFDGTGVQFFASVWTNEKRITKLLDLAVIVSRALVIGEDPENPSSEECEILISAPWEETSLVKKSGYWDLLAVFPDTTRHYYLEGPATVNLNVSEEPVP